MAAKINHGTLRGYRAGCRCDACRGSNNAAKRLERERKQAREGRQPRPVLRAVPTGDDVPVIGPTYGPIETAFRAALAEPTDDHLVVARREMVFAAARVMDNPKAVAFFKSAADVLRSTVAELLESKPEQDGEADALASIMASFGGTRGR